MTMYLYRKWRPRVTLAGTLAVALALLSPTLVAQWRAPQPERKTPRAVAVLETYENGSRRLIPVTFFYERRYFDATLYRAAPVPFTLSPDTVYEVQRFGKPLGTFTLRSATRSASDAWFGHGFFRAALDVSALAKKTAAPVVVAADPSRPVLHRREGSQGDRAVATKAAAAPAGDDDPERPRLHRRDEPGAENPAAASPAQADRQPSLSAAAAAASTEPSPAAEPDRPILRRGKPLEEQSGRDLPPGAGKPGGKIPEPVRQVAVSDAGPSEPRELLFALPEPQRRQIEASTRELAQSELRRLAPVRDLSLPGASATQPAAQPAAQPATQPATQPALTLEDEQFVPYDLDYNDYATVVFSARYRPSASGGPGKEQSWVVTIIARQDGEKLVTLYSAVSDPRELDLYPELRLVDAVDPDGYGRCALLFREQKRDGVSWLLGRVSGYELQTLYETAPR